MASCCDVSVMLSLGFDYHDNEKDRELHAYLTAPLPEAGSNKLDGQRLTLVSGREIADDLAGSAQAGTIRMYAGLIRRGYAEEIREYLKAAPWNHREAVIFIQPEDWDSTVDHINAREDVHGLSAWR
jgi:hypothetical protein